jgi:predicted DNA-binding transcriptional regulator YafY
MARGDQLARQWRIIQKLVASKHVKTVAELGREENFTLRTIYRDLEALQEAGFPI